MLVKAFSEDYQLKFRPHQVEGPASPREYLDWNTRLRKWRLEQQQCKTETHSTTGYDVPGLQVSFIIKKLTTKHLNKLVVSGHKLLTFSHTLWRMICSSLTPKPTSILSTDI